MDEPRLKKLCLTVAKADCANNCDGQCIPQGVPCFAYIPACGVCTWFRDAVLPANGPLQSAVLEKMGETPVTGKTCDICGQPFSPVPIGSVIARIVQKKLIGLPMHGVYVITAL